MTTVQADTTNVGLNTLDEPVMDTIKQRIDAMQLQDALRQAELFDSQIREIQTIIANG